MPNDLLLWLRIEAWKPALTALLLPPAPFLLLMLVGAAQPPRRRKWAWALLLCGAAGIWLSCTEAVTEALQCALLGELHVISPEALRSSGASAPKSAIVVLGGGREPFADEYRSADLGPFSLQRLRYGLWLARESALPVAFSGGIGHGQAEGPSEAAIAARITAREFGQPLRWTEERSRDTRENAERTLALLRPEGVKRIVLVTHGWHMRRSLRAFERAIAHQGRQERPLRCVASRVFPR
jgi:uncharacterized SAM-binding protein YcdF (DUF218 family)